MTLKDLHEQLKSLNRELCNSQAQVIEYGCEKLIRLLSQFAEYHDIPIISKENDGDVWINLRYICRIGIRYCGHFINTIIIKSDESKGARDRIKLTYASYEDEEDFESCACYNCDSYFGKTGDAIPYIGILNDWKNFRNLIESLEPFFAVSGKLHEDFQNTLQNIKHNYQKETYKIQDKLNMLQEDIDDYFNKIFKRFKEYDRKRKKHFIILPNNLSIRYHGRFHNCIVKDDYSISLGFIKKQDFFPEEGYRKDEYTVENDFGRYNDDTYSLLHETSLNLYHEGQYELSHALDTLVFICGDDMEKINEDDKPDLRRYKDSTFVEYIHTKLTD